MISETKFRVETPYGIKFFQILHFQKHGPIILKRLAKKNFKNLTTHHGLIDVACIQLHVDLFVDCCLAGFAVIVTNGGHCCWCFVYGTFDLKVKVW